MPMVLLHSLTPSLASQRWSKTIRFIFKVRKKKQELNEPAEDGEQDSGNPAKIIFLYWHINKWFEVSSSGVASFKGQANRLLRLN